MAANMHPEAIGRGIAEQIGLACRIAPAVAARRLNNARVWWFELPTPTVNSPPADCTNGSPRPW